MASYPSLSLAGSIGLFRGQNIMFTCSRNMLVDETTGGLRRLDALNCFSLRHLHLHTSLEPKTISYSMNLAQHMSTAATLFCESIQVCTVCTEVLWIEMRPTSLVSSDI